MIGDGGQSGFDVADPNSGSTRSSTPAPRSTSTTVTSPTGSGSADPIFGQPGTQFYAPVISDPRVSGTMFAGTGLTVYRTKTFGLGDRTHRRGQRGSATAWTGTFEAQCGDWARAGPDPADRRRLGRPGRRRGRGDRAHHGRHVDRVGGHDHRPGLHLQATSTPSRPSAVSWTRLDDDVAADPNRFVSSIYVDPANGNRAWISYSGFNVEHPGHAGARLRGDLRPGDRHLDLGGPVVRLR